MSGHPESEEVGQGGRFPVGALLQRGSIYAIAIAIQASAGVLALPFLTRLLAPEELGVVSLALIVQVVLGTVAALGLPASVMRDFFRGGGAAGARAIVAWTGLAAVGIAAVAVATVTGWAEVIGAAGDEATLRIAAVSAVGLAILTSAQSLLRAQDRAALFVATMVLGTIGAQVLGLAATAVVDGGPEAYFAGLATGIFIGATLGAAAVGARPADLRRPSGVRSALAIGLPTIPHTLGVYVLSAGDRAVIARLEDLASVGQYQVAYMIGALALTVLGAANNAWTPIVFGAPEERRWRVLGETAAVLWKLLPFGVGVLAIASPIALAVAAPPSYDPTALAPVTAIVAFAAVPQLVYMGAFLPLYWVGRLTALTWITPLAAVANIGLNLALVPSLGLEGAAVATVLSYGAMAALTWWRARGLAAIPWPAGTMLASAAAAAAMAAVGAAAPTTGAGWQIARGLAAAGLVTGGLIVARRAIAAERATLAARSG